ncbi:ADP-ribosylglycohydrolase [Kribbella sp. ALI-6-A]|uniref:ADP-ribosylglycohydrolase family protein n=1 Tax=Kribbella sp. ALI-6-A TaxID=1933817 RepID=UPI00097C0049|nr:ADP-ribosylglycohydrolase family protein [Kribbella sp. ALI-6-A]ONI68582.1 ADP-ribosylglycohydrolase [Kribbella sp. ALI-6-A]
MTSAESRAAGALYGLAIGDALGMPTQSLPRARIVERYGEVIDGLHPAPDDQPLAAGMPAGAITDDTEQAVLLARLVIEGNGLVDGHELARRLIAWEDDMRARGSLDLLGPSTKRALDELLAGGDITRTGRYGTTNGAAMRITPVGIATPADEVELLVDRVVAASAPTHNTGLALSAAAAVAAAVGAGVDGATVPEATTAAVAAARSAAHHGYWVAGADVGIRIGWAVTVLTQSDGATLEPGAAADLLYGLVGTSLASQESVPAAFAVANGCDDPWTVVRVAASLGGDTDTIAAIAGAVVGACHGVDAFPADVRRTVAAVNGLDLDSLAGELLKVRRG